MLAQFTGRSSPSCVRGVVLNSKSTDTHTHTHTHHPQPLPHQPQTTRLKPHTHTHKPHRQTAHPPTPTNPPPTRNVIDRLSLGDKWMPCFVISCHNLFLSGLGNVRVCCLPWKWKPFTRRVRQIRRHKRSITNTTEGGKEVWCVRVRVVLYCVVVLGVVLWCMLYVLSCEFCV